MRHGDLRHGTIRTGNDFEIKEYHHCAQQSFGHTQNSSGRRRATETKCCARIGYNELLLRSDCSSEAVAFGLQTDCIAGACAASRFTESCAVGCFAHGFTSEGAFLRLLGLPSTIGRVPCFQHNKTSSFGPQCEGRGPYPQLLIHGKSMWSLIRVLWNVIRRRLLLLPSLLVVAICWY
jgi:hypothetical protein